MQVLVFGNEDIAVDALPLKLLPALQEAFPDTLFRVLDPNEEWDIPAEVVVLDTVVGIDAVKTFEGLDAFMAAPRITCHDFDAYANLKLLQKLGKLTRITVIGVPPSMSANAALPPITDALAASMGRRQGSTGEGA